MNKLLNDNAVLTDKQKNFIDKYFDEYDHSDVCSSKDLEEMLEKEMELIGATAI
jgi:hypothetical protein